jgi:hypothetical protein
MPPWQSSEDGDENVTASKPTKASRIHPSAQNELDGGGAPLTAPAPDINNTAWAPQNLVGFRGIQRRAYSEKVALSFGINRREVCVYVCLCICI